MRFTSAPFVRLLYRICPRRALLAFISIAAMLFGANHALALDSTRALTQYIHRIWQVQQGLPQSTIYCVYQSSDGYLWLGTQQGLFRFDGVRFATLDLPGTDDLKTAWVHDIIEGPDKSLWVATHENGLFNISPQGRVLHLVRGDGLPSNRVYRIVKDHAGQLWACTSDGLASISADDRSAGSQVFQMQQGLPSNDVVAACEDATGHLCVATTTGAQISISDGTLFHARPLTSVPPSAIVHDLLCTRDGTLLVATSAGLVALHGAQEKRYTEADGLAGNEVYRLMQGPDSTIWIGTNNGFSRLRNDILERFQARDGLSQSTVYSLCLDHEGSLWVGTKHGLNQFIDGRTIPFTTREGLPSDDTGPILQDAQGRIWVGTLGAGLSRLDQDSFSTLTIADGLLSNRILSLAEDPDGTLWIGTDHGLNHLSHGKIDRRFTTADGLPANDIRCVLVSSTGTVFAGTGAGLAALQNEKWSPIPSVDASPSVAIQALAETSVGILAAREGQGLLLIADGRARDFAPDGDSVHDVDSIFEDSDKLLWLGMKGEGLGLYDGHKMVTFSVQDGLFDDDLRCIVGDREDHLWMACSKGIFTVSRHDLNRVAGGLQKTVISQPFSPTEGLRTIECRAGVSPAAWRMADGRIWFSTIRGLIEIDPAHLQRNLPPPPVTIEQVLLDGRPLPRTTEARIAPGVKNVEFRYTGLSFINPSRMTFRYQLEGFDRGWVDAGLRREAFYTNLPPGTFHFRVAASNADGTWSEAALPVTIILEPYIYQQFWFIPACAAVAGLFIVIAYRLRLRGERQRLAMIFAERGRIARELHDTLIQGFSGVTMEMQAFLARLRSDDDRHGLSEIIRDAGICLREARRSIAGLRELDESHTGFNSLLADAARQLVRNKPIRLQLRFKPRLPVLAAEVEYNLMRIAQEAIINTLRHASARSIEVLLEAPDTEIIMEVRDDGRGFVAGKAPAAGEGAGHFGLVGMRERAEEIGATLEIESTPARGTLVRVRLPAKSQPQPRETDQLSGAKHP